MNALNFIRSAYAPVISAGVITANIIWKSMKAWCGMVAAYVGLGSAPTPRTNSNHRVSFLSLSSVPARKDAPQWTDESDKSTTRTRRLEKLRTSEVRYRRLFETAKDGILLLDADTGRITDVNPFLEDMLGYSHTELIGKALWEIGPVKDISASQDAMRHLQKKKYIRYENLPLETKAGQRIQVEFVSNVQSRKERVCSYLAHFLHGVLVS